MPAANSILEVPGYCAALEQEQLVRDTAFLLTHEHIAGFTVWPLTLRQYLGLRLAGSPFLPPFRPATPEDLSLFLWCRSPEFTPQESAAKKQFRKRCSLFYAPAPPLFRTRRAMNQWHAQSAAADRLFQQISGAALANMLETMQDKPDGGGSGTSYYADACALCARLARELGFSETQTLDLPLKRLFQYLREAREHQANANGKTAVLANRSDEKIAEFLETINRKN